MINFNKKLKSGNQPKKINPVEIYDSLDRKSEAGPLRPTQSRILKTWNTQRRGNHDVIVKLHTGAGKTLIGLLMAQSYINSNEGPALYICPNKYLMQQACAEAKKFGVPFCFIGNDNMLPNDFVSGQKVLITYVQKVFNGWSIFGIGNHSMHAGCIILDDSHACIDSILGACTITIEKGTNAYDELKQLFEDDIKIQGEGSYQDLLNGSYSAVLPIPYWNWQDKVSRVTEIIAKATGDLNVKFAWPVLRDQLKMCQSYISCSKIEIAPTCIPIKSFGVFNNATHRILMSATTQEDTFFIKGLGLSVDAVKNPLIDEQYTWSGEKMILIPDLICEHCDSVIIRDTLAKIENKGFGVVVLTPSFEKANWYVERGFKLANEPGKNMFVALTDYKESGYKDQKMVLANRYDGVDLPDDSCRILILDSLPYYNSLPDRYEELCRTNSEIIRVKTIQKIEQGLGRSVRGEKDYCAILILGSDLIKYLRSANNTKFFSAQTQKQIEIGFDIVDMAKEDGDKTAKGEIEILFSTIEQCITRNDGWKTYYSTTMDTTTSLNFDRTLMYSILEKEKVAFDMASADDFFGACSTIQSVVDSLGEKSEKGWYLQLLAKYKYAISKHEANELQVSAFKNNNQLLRPISGISYKKINFEINDNRVTQIRDYLLKFSDYQQLIIDIENMLSNLSFGIDHETFERAVQQLGNLLGYISQRPDKDIRKGPDNLWCVGINKYIMIECKSEVIASRSTISKSEAGQMEEHCAWFEAEYNNAEVQRVMIIPTSKMAFDAYFSHDIYVITKRELNEFKKVVRSFVTEFKSYNLETITSETIQVILANHHLKETDILGSYMIKAKH